jgi:hypothetical protein
LSNPAMSSECIGNKRQNSHTLLGTRDQFVTTL